MDCSCSNCNKPRARKRVISLGRLNKTKQFDLLIRAFSLLADEFPDWDLWIWGEGPERAALEAQVGNCAWASGSSCPAAR